MRRHRERPGFIGDQAAEDPPQRREIQPTRAVVKDRAPFFGSAVDGFDKTVVFCHSARLPNKIRLLGSKTGFSRCPEESPEIASIFSM
jgi:hypothetical protein